MDEKESKELIHRIELREQKEENLPLVWNLHRN